MEVSQNYPKLKQALLVRFLLTAGDYRGRFYKSKQGVDETAAQFLCRLDHCLSQWINLAGIGENYAEVKELILCEQVLHYCPCDLAMFTKGAFSIEHGGC